jgi:anti-anti-sigma factor
MNLTQQDHEHLTVFRVRGELAGESCDGFRRATLSRMDAQIRDFVLDLSETEFVDSQGLETLLWLQEVAGERLGQVRLAGVSDSVRRILEVTRLASRFDARSDVESAIRSLG